MPENLAGTAGATSGQSPKDGGAMRPDARILGTGKVPQPATAMSVRPTRPAVVPAKPAPTTQPKPAPGAVAPGAGAKAPMSPQQLGTQAAQSKPSLAEDINTAFNPWAQTGSAEGNGQGGLLDPNQKPDLSNEAEATKPPIHEAQSGNPARQPEQGLGAVNAVGLGLAAAKANPLGMVASLLPSAYQDAKWLTGNGSSESDYRQATSYGQGQGFWGNYVAPHVNASGGGILRGAGTMLDTARELGNAAASAWENRGSVADRQARQQQDPGRQGQIDQWLLSQGTHYRNAQGRVVPTPQYLAQAAAE